MKLLSLWLLLLCASVAFAQNENASLPLTPRIKTALVARAEALKGSNINVDTDSKTHTITLSGTVISTAQKTLAGAIARDEAGTFQVQNRLFIRSEKPDPQSVAPVKYARTVHFLQLLANSQGRADGTTFRDHKTPFPSVSRVMSFVSKHGVTIVDANENGGKPLILSRTRLERDLKRTGSAAFDSFAYVGYIFAMPYAQYSSLTFKPARNGVVTELAGGHRLTWERENGRLQLRKLEYLRLEGE